MALVLALAGCGPEPDRPAAADAPLIGLSTSLPLLWAESGDIQGQLAQEAPAHWALSLLEQTGKVVPLDTLAGAEGRLSLPQDALLLLVQPAPLAPDENVALDAWVRAGGRLLLFADPMLTAESVYPLGDPRRPQTIVMLSPILRHWGLDLEFDPDQAAGEHQAKAYGVPLPVNLPGRFRTSASVDCQLHADGLIAECGIEAGRVIAVADAAVFDGDDAGRTAAVETLIGRIAR